MRGPMMCVFFLRKATMACSDLILLVKMITGGLLRVLGLRRKASAWIWVEVVAIVAGVVVMYVVGWLFVSQAHSYSQAEAVSFIITIGISTTHTSESYQWTHNAFVHDEPVAGFG